MPAEISFQRDVSAVLSKAGCNAGTCHGNANGKGGFKLSLRSEDPVLDFNALTRDQLGRRVNQIAPDQSLLLLKATAQNAHEGGKRFEKDSIEYRILRDWIATGMKTDAPDLPKPSGLEVQFAKAGSAHPVPSSALSQSLLTSAHTMKPVDGGLIVLDQGNALQLQATARFADGSTRDVSSLAVYEPVGDIAKAGHDGLIERQKFGETTVLVRYLNQQMPVRLAFVPDQPGFKWSRPRENNVVDKEVFAKLRQLRMNPSELCSDEVFIRRAYLDLLGLVPGAEEARAFVKNRSRSKRAKLIDALLERPEFADFWALKWSDLLRNEEHALDAKGVQVFNGWIRQSIAEHKPLDQFVREIVVARGSTYSVPPANFWRANRDPIMRAETTAQVFLGTRLQCAKCHNHPFDRWTQNDYYGWSAVFAGIDYKVLENKRIISTDKHEWNGEQVVFISNKGNVTDPRTGRPAPPALLAARTEVSGSDSEGRLDALATWLTNPDNPYFARTQVNRIWYHLMGRGLVEPVDDFRATNPPSHPELLDALTHDFVKHGFDIRQTIRAIMNSRSYQLTTEPNASNRADATNYSHNQIRRLTAEQLLDSQSEATGAPLKFAGHPPGTRAAQLAGVNPKHKQGRKRVGADDFLDVFGKPPRLVASETERSCEPTMSQAFQMVSGPVLNELIQSPDNRLGKWITPARKVESTVEELYWAALTRPPTPAEMKGALAYLKGAKDQRQALEDVLWSLLNAKEFVFRQ